MGQLDLCGPGITYGISSAEYNSNVAALVQGLNSEAAICHDEVPFLAHSRLGPPGLLIQCSLWESQLLLTWQIWFALGLCLTHFSVPLTSKETCPGLASWQQGLVAQGLALEGPRGWQALKGEAALPQDCASRARAPPSHHAHLPEPPVLLLRPTRLVVAGQG